MLNPRLARNRRNRDDAVRNDRIAILSGMRQRPDRLCQHGGRHAGDGQQDDF
jgi:hypothetical protein